ncbi:LLM class flavin-dependent oxidoreductase [Streptomyces flaveolus]|uniref:LLM class flavin-dependent oxidoreductase n=1 Tax=Streptomyces flaveolus TaxID=67297 RepID=UPI0036F947B2
MISIARRAGQSARKTVPGRRLMSRRVPLGTYRLPSVEDMQRTTPNGAEVELGVFSLTETVPGDTGAQRVRDIVEVGVFADRAGLDVFGVGEHHTPRFAVSSPAIVLAATAARTSSLTLTGAVSVLACSTPSVSTGPRALASTARLSRRWPVLTAPSWSAAPRRSA